MEPRRSWHRNPFALKLSIVTDQNGVSYGARTDPGNRPDVTLLSASLDAMLLNIERVPLYADRGYDSRNNRRICANAGLADRIFRRRTKTVRRTNARRIVVEHAFAWLVKLHLSDQRRDRPLAEHKKHKQALTFVASDVCKPSGVPFESDASHHDW